MADNKTTAIVIVSLSILASIILIFFHAPILMLAIPGLFIFLVVYFYYGVQKEVRERKVKEAEWKRQLEEAKRKLELETPKRLKEEEKRSKRWSLLKPDVDKIIDLLNTIRRTEDFMDQGIYDDNYDNYNAASGDIEKMEHEIREIGERFYKVEGITTLQEVRSYLEKMGEEWYRLGDYWKVINREFYNETQVAWRKKSR
jgi:hypothetical protein